MKLEIAYKNSPIDLSGGGRVDLGGVRSGSGPSVGWVWVRWVELSNFMSQGEVDGMGGIMPH